MTEATPARSPEEGEKPQRVSLVVSMYNSKPETLGIIKGLFLPSLLNNLTSKTQLVIVDDGSPLYGETRKMVDSFEDELMSRAGDVVYRRLEENQGFAGAYNKGIERADGEVVMIANDDIYLPKGSVKSLVEVLVLKPETGAVGPVIDNCWSFQSTSLFGRIQDLSPEQLKKIEDFSLWLKEVMAGKRYKIEHPRATLAGTCLAFKREVLNRIGLLDTRYKYGLFEDSDWLRRVKLAGYDLLVDAATFVEHGGPEGGSHSLKQHPGKQSRAFILNAIKYGQKWNCLGVLPVDLARAKLQSFGLMSINGEIIRCAKERGLWDKYLGLTRSK